MQRLPRQDHIQVWGEESCLSLHYLHLFGTKNLGKFACGLRNWWIHPESNNNNNTNKVPLEEVSWWGEEEREVLPS